MKKIAILGASYLQLPLVEKCRDLGIETHCFAWDKDAVCKDIADYYYPISVLEEEKILEKCIEIGIDGITTIAMDICIPVINNIAKKLNLIGNSMFCSISTTNKAKMRELFEAHQIPSPKSTIVTLDSFDTFQFIDFPFIVKPTDRSGSLGVTLVYNTKDLKKAVEYACNCSFEKKCVVEQYIKGREVSVESISYKGEHRILAITDKVITNESYFVEIEHHQPTSVSENLKDKIEKLVLQILDVTDLKNGDRHTELIIDEKNNVYAIEIGSRMGGDFIGSHLVKLSTGHDFVKYVVDIALGQFKLPNDVKTKNYSGVYFLSSENKHLLKYFNEDYDFIVKKEITNNELNTLRSSSDRSGYIIYQSSKFVSL